MTAGEWANARTLGPAPPGDKLLLGFFHAVQPRTAGCNAWDYADVTDGTRADQDFTHATPETVVEEGDLIIVSARLVGSSASPSRPDGQPLPPLGSP